MLIDLKKTKCVPLVWLFRVPTSSLGDNKSNGEDKEKKGVEGAASDRAQMEFEIKQAA